MTARFLKRFVCVDRILLLIVWSSIGVDRAESDPKECRQINHDLPVNLAIACREFDATLIQLSTDYIFDGQKDIAYFENDAPNPLNLFGQTRLEAERDIENLLDQHIILRVSHLFAPGGNSFVTNLLDRARIEAELPMIQDERGCPTSIYDVSRVISAVIDQLHAVQVPTVSIMLGAKVMRPGWSSVNVSLHKRVSLKTWPLRKLLEYRGQSVNGRAERPHDWYCQHESYCIPSASNPDHGGKSWRQQLNATMHVKERNMRRFDSSQAVRQRMLRLKKRKTVLRRQQSLREKCYRLSMRSRISQLITKNHL